MEIPRSCQYTVPRGVFQRPQQPDIFGDRQPHQPGDVWAGDFGAECQQPDQRDGRKPSSVPTNDYYGREYRRGYEGGARAYAQRLEGRSERRSTASRDEVA